VRDHPERLEYAVELGASYCNLAGLANERVRYAAALEGFAQAERVLQGVLRREPRHQTALEFLRNTVVNRAQALTLLGRHEEALAAWDRAAEVTSPGPGHDYVRAGRALTLARLGRHADAVAAAEALSARPRLDDAPLWNLASACSLASAAARQDQQLSEGKRERKAEEYAARAVALLARARRDGHFQKPEWGTALGQDPALAPLRQRADFQQLLAPPDRKESSPR
jgi:tetratricopeptide (TPR) repeat protein